MMSVNNSVDMNGGRASCNTDPDDEVVDVVEGLRMLG